MAGSPSVTLRRFAADSPRRRTIGGRVRPGGRVRSGGRVRVRHSAGRTRRPWRR